MLAFSSCSKLLRCSFSTPRWRHWLLIIDTLGFSLTLYHWDIIYPRHVPMRNTPTLLVLQFSLILVLWYFDIHYLPTHRKKRQWNDQKSEWNEEVNLFYFVHAELGNYAFLWDKRRMCNHSVLFWPRQWLWWMKCCVKFNFIDKIFSNEWQWCVT